MVLFGLGDVDDSVEEIESSPTRGTRAVNGGAVERGVVGVVERGGVVEVVVRGAVEVVERGGVIGGGAVVVVVVERIVAGDVRSRLLPFSLFCA